MLSAICLLYSLISGALISYSLFLRQREIGGKRTEAKDMNDLYIPIDGIFVKKKVLPSLGSDASHISMSMATIFMSFIIGLIFFLAGIVMSGLLSSLVLFLFSLLIVVVAVKIFQKEHLSS
jgi:hypothetical protein